VFAECGSDASLEEIARRAGVGIGTLYRHFPTRDAWSRQCSATWSTRRHRAANNAHFGHPADALASWLREQMRQSSACRGLAAEAMIMMLDEQGCGASNACDALHDIGAKLLAASAVIRAVSAPTPRSTTFCDLSTRLASPRRRARSRGAVRSVVRSDDARSSARRPMKFDGRRRLPLARGIRLARTGADDEGNRGALRGQADRADENQRLIEAVFTQLDELEPRGFTTRCSASRTASAFVHVVIEHDVDDPDSLPAVPAFQSFVVGINDRCAVRRGDGRHLVGGYR
jgi:AcrR family transcriptional regulator